jgi:hypothetical protein
MIKIILFIIILYIQLSLGEIYIHKFVMHNKPNTFMRTLWGDSHLLHHEEVYENMGIKEDFLHEGMYFSLFTIISVSILVYGVIYADLKLIHIKMNALNIGIMSCSLGLFYYFAWNILHTRFHRVYPSKILEQNMLFSFLLRNHSYHHLQKGLKKGNYNIIFIGGDHLVNTYRSCVDNKNFCKQYYNKHKKLCDMEQNKDELPFGLKWC